MKSRSAQCGAYTLTVQDGGHKFTATCNGHVVHVGDLDSPSMPGVPRAMFLDAIGQLGGLRRTPVAPQPQPALEVYVPPTPDADGGVEVADKPKPKRPKKPRKGAKKGSSK